MKNQYIFLGYTYSEQAWYFHYNGKWVSVHISPVRAAPRIFQATAKYFKPDLIVVHDS